MITKEEVEKIGRLSRLEIKDSEKESYIEELSKVLNYMEKLNELDTTNVEPTIVVLDLSNVFREDVVVESLDRELALKNGPDKDEEFFIVPQII